MYRVMQNAKNGKSNGRQRNLSCDAARDKGQRIFEDDEDRDQFLEILKKSKEAVPSGTVLFDTR